MASEVTITVGVEGAVEVKVDGVAGPSCEALTKGIEKALGNVQSDKRTPEFYAAQSQANSQKQ